MKRTARAAMERANSVSSNGEDEGRMSDQSSIKDSSKHDFVGQSSSSLASESMTMVADLDESEGNSLDQEDFYSSPTRHASKGRKSSIVLRGQSALEGVVEEEDIYDEEDLFDDDLFV